MEVRYHSTLQHNGVTFYVSASGDLAHFAYGGTVLSVCRPTGGDPPSVAKFGLVLRGVTPFDSAVANYVRSRLSQREGVRVPTSDSDVFVHDLALLVPDRRVADIDLCDNLDLEVYDPVLAEYLVSLKVTAGLVITTGRHCADTKTLKLFPVPEIVNACSGFVYVANPASFVLVQAYQDALPTTLQDIVAGLFDAVPAVRAPLHPVPLAHEVVVTSAKALPTQFVRWQSTPAPPTEPESHAGRVARINAFVQVRYIVAQRSADVWERKNSSSGSNSVCVLSRILHAVDDVFASDGWVDGNEAIAHVFGVVQKAMRAIFGPRRPRPLFGGVLEPAGVSVHQRFVVFQFLMSKWGLWNCYGALEKLVTAYVVWSQQRLSAACSQGERPDVVAAREDLAIRTANAIARELALVAVVAGEIVLAHLPPRTVALVDKAVMQDATTTLFLANRQTRGGRVKDATVDEVHSMEAGLAVFLAAVYRNGVGGGVQVACETFRSQWPVVAEMEARTFTAFDASLASRASTQYLQQILTRRLSHAGIEYPDDSGTA